MYYKKNGSEYFVKKLQPYGTIAGLLSAGTNVTVTGSGTTGSPYVISSSGGGGGGSYLLTAGGGGAREHSSSTGAGGGGSGGLYECRSSYGSPTSVVSTNAYQTGAGYVTFTYSGEFATGGWSVGFLKF